MRRHLTMIAALAVLGTALAAGAASASSPISTGQGGVDITVPSGGNLPPVGALPQCSDGVDNDGNGLVDMADPGCSSPLDPSESGGTPPTGTTGPTGPTPPTGPTGPAPPTGQTGPVGVHPGQGNSGGSGSTASASSAGASGNSSRSFSNAHGLRHGHATRDNSGGASVRNQLPPERKPNGVPTTSNPTTTIGIGSPPPLGVPNFIISQFTIPPFLLPIYQACGTEYNIPWNVLASINKIESGFGTNMGPSSAGAIGWMQFLPSTWKTWGLDANGDGQADPYNPVDAICSAARYLKASGGQSNIRKAIFAYNHASWYVDEVMLYARQYGGVPSDTLSSLTGLNEGDRFPVTGDVRYADDVADRANSGGGGQALTSATRRGLNIYAQSGAKVVAVNDGTIKKMGHTKKLGNYVVLADAYGNRFTYAQLGSVAKAYPVAKRQHLTAADFDLVQPGDHGKSTTRAAAGKAAHAAAAEAAADKASKASKGTKPSRSSKASASERAAKASRARVKAERAAAHSGPTNTEDLRPRLSADPRGAKKSGGSSAGGQLNSLLEHRMLGYHAAKAYLGSVLPFNKKKMTLRKLHVGSKVTGGTVLGRIGKTTTLAPHVNFSIQTSGQGASGIDPKPILDGWKLLQETAVYRAAQPKQIAATIARYAPMGTVRLQPGVQTNAGVEPTIVRALKALSGMVGKPVYVISGYRTPAHSVAVGGFADDPHTQGAAADIGVGAPTLSSATSVAESTYNRVGLYRPFYPAQAGEANHVQLIHGPLGPGSYGQAIGGYGGTAGTLPIVGTNPFNPRASVTQALLASKQQLQRQVLSDPRLSIYKCGRNDVMTGQIDRRVLAGMEYLADQGFRLTVTALKCGSSKKELVKAGAPKGDKNGTSVEISAIDGVPVAGHQDTGSLSYELIKSALKLQGVMAPQQIISAENLPGPVSFRKRGYADRIHIGYPATSGSGYQFPFVSYTWGRTDMGVDFTGSGPINAIGNAQILRVGAPGWPNGGAGPAGQGVLYRLLDGPEAGHVIYVYEGVVPTVKAGQTVVAGQQIARFYPGSSMEIGWADAAGRPLAAPVYSEGDVTKAGSSFRAFLQSLGGGPARVGRQFDQLMSSSQWKKLVGRISSGQQASAATEPSQAAVKPHHDGSTKGSAHH